MEHRRLIEFTFFYGALAFVGYMVWHIFAPFFTALALSAIIVVICYPLYEFLLKYFARNSRTVAALFTTIIVFSVLVIPVFLISTLLINEFVSFYRTLDVGTQLPIDTLLTGVEENVQLYVPGFDINLSEQIRQSVEWFTSHIGTIFAGTVSVIFTFLISIMGSFYLFRDGKSLVRWFISVSPLKDTEDLAILDRMARSIRSVATGTVFVSIIQGVTAAVGFSFFGIDRAILWGSVAALGALLPGVGTAGIMVPAVIFLFYTSTLGNAIGLLIWAVLAIVIVDNILGPYLMGRGNSLHPFVILISVLGGVILFGPVGFILGPVCISLFMVLLELYGVYMNANVRDNPKIKRK